MEKSLGIAVKPHRILPILLGTLMGGFLIYRRFPFWPGGMDESPATISAVYVSSWQILGKFGLWFVTVLGEFLPNAGRWSLAGLWWLNLTALVVLAVAMTPRRFMPWAAMTCWVLHPLPYIALTSLRGVPLFLSLLFVQFAILSRASALQRTRDPLLTAVAFGLGAAAILCHPMGIGVIPALLTLEYSHNRRSPFYHQGGLCLLIITFLLLVGSAVAVALQKWPPAFVNIWKMGALLKDRLLPLAEMPVFLLEGQFRATIGLHGEWVLLNRLMITTWWVAPALCLLLGLLAQSLVISLPSEYERQLRWSFAALFLLPVVKVSATSLFSPEDALLIIMLPAWCLLMGTFFAVLAEWLDISLGKVSVFLFATLIAAGLVFAAFPLNAGPVVRFTWKREAALARLETPASALINVSLRDYADLDGIGNVSIYRVWDEELRLCWQKDEFLGAFANARRFNGPLP